MVSTLKPLSLFKEGLRNFISIASIIYVAFECVTFRGKNFSE